MPFFFSAERHSISKAVAYSCSSALICSIERNIGVKEENWSPSVSFCLQTTKLFVIFLYFRIRRIGCDSWLTKTLIPFMHTGNIQRASNFFRKFTFSKVCMRINCVHNATRTPVWFEVTRSSASVLSKQIHGSTQWKTRLGKPNLARW